MQPLAYSTASIPLSAASTDDVLLRNQEIKLFLEEYREKMLQRWANNHSLSYAENNSALFYENFVSTLKRRRKGQPAIPYYYENATDSICAPEQGARRFGVEIEFVIQRGRDKAAALVAIGEDLYASGLISKPTQSGRRAARESAWSAWSYEIDRTVDAEIVSPILCDETKSWTDLALVLDIIKKHRGTVNKKCGSHIHVSTASYGLSSAKHAELLRLVTKYEDLLYRLAAHPKRGAHRGIAYCEPNAIDALGDIADELMEGYQILGQDNRYAALNLTETAQVDHGKSHVEFRLWDGTLDAAVIQQQILVSAALVDYAERKVLIERSSRKDLSPHRARGSVRGEHGGKLARRTYPDALSFHEINGDIACLIDKLFLSARAKESVTALFAVTKWQQSLDKDKKHSRIVFSDT